MISENISIALAKAGIEAEVDTREKHLYSIYKKMLRKRSALSEIVDVYGLRVVVASADECYRALGVVHGAYKPMPGRFKDYIAIPRVNGYQSLHTTLFGPNGIPMEVQIIEVGEFIAMVKTITPDFTDYLQLGKMEGQWKIYHAVWDRPRPD